MDREPVEDEGGRVRLGDRGCSVHLVGRVVVEDVEHGAGSLDTVLRRVEVGADLADGREGLRGEDEHEHRGAQPE